MAVLETGNGSSGNAVLVLHQQITAVLFQKNILPFGRPFAGFLVKLPVQAAQIRVLNQYPALSVRIADNVVCLFLNRSCGGLGKLFAGDDIGIETLAAVQRIVAGAACQSVVTQTAVQRIVAFAAVQIVVAGNGQIAVVVTPQNIVAFSAV